MKVPVQPVLKGDAKHFKHSNEITVSLQVMNKEHNLGLRGEF